MRKLGISIYSSCTNNHPLWPEWDGNPVGQRVSTEFAPYTLGRIPSNPVGGVHDGLDFFLEGNPLGRVGDILMLGQPFKWKQYFHAREMAFYLSVEFVHDSSVSDSNGWPVSKFVTTLVS